MKTRRVPIPFVKGHMGGNEIVLLDGAHVPSGLELDFARRVLHAPHVGGHEAGLLYATGEETVICSTLIAGTGNPFITMCGGLTQVLGLALTETSVSDWVNMVRPQPGTTVILDTPAGRVPLRIESDESTGATRTYTDMRPTVDECHALGIRPIDLEGLEVWDVGEMLVVHAEDLKHYDERMSFSPIDRHTADKLRSLQIDFVRAAYADNLAKPKTNHPDPETGGTCSCTFCLYDELPDHGGTARAMFPHYLPGQVIEPACGTGSVGIVLAMAARGRLPGHGNVREVRIEEGGEGTALGGGDTATLRVHLDPAGRVITVEMHYDRVEILAEGTAWV